MWTQREGCGLEMAARYCGTEKTIIFIIWPIACSITLLHTVRLLPELRRRLAMLQTDCNKENITWRLAPQEKVCFCSMREKNARSNVGLHQINA